MNIIRQIVNRDCHVSMTNKKVIRHVISKLVNKEQSFYSMPKEQRKLFMKMCIAEHALNQQLYNDVMTGNL